jgi:hypothetical protein
MTAPTVTSAFAPFTTTALPNALYLPLCLYSSRLAGLLRVLAGITLIVVYAMLIFPRLWGIIVLLVAGKATVHLNSL